MLKTQALIINLAQENQRQHDTQHMESSNPLRTEFPINSYVLVNYSNTSLTKKGAPTKLHPNKKGPLRVVNFIGSKYVLQDLVTNKCEDYHISLLTPFQYDAARVNLKDIANRDYHLRELKEITCASSRVHG